MLKKYFLIIVFFISLFFTTISQSNINIEITIDDEIITNIDIENEANYLKILNPSLIQLNKKKILEISRESLIREVVKKKEIEKVFDLSKDNPFINEYMKNLYLKLNFDNEDDFNTYLNNSSNYSIDDVREKLKIEIAWNELIYLKYSKQISVDKIKLQKKIDLLSEKKIKEYKLSEIIFKKNKDEDISNLKKKIISSISEIGFDNTANLYSISDSSKFGGDIGWVVENNLSGLLFNELKKISVGQHTDVIKIGNNYIILKIEELREIQSSIDKKEELQKMIKFETNKQLNQFSRIFFDKSKMNYTINEK